MKIFSKIIFGLSLSAQVFAAPLELRQAGTITVTEAAVNQLLSRVLTELYVINAAPTGLSMINAPGILTAVQSDITSLTSSLESASSIISGATDLVTCTVTSTPPISTGDVTMLLSTVNMAQSIVSSLQTTLTNAVSALSSSNAAALAPSITGLETSLNTFNMDLQIYTLSLLPCVNAVTPSFVQPLESTLTSLGNTVQDLLNQLGVSGILNGLITTIIP